MVDNIEIDPQETLDEGEVLYDAALNPNKHYSVINAVKYARENANGARDLISTELYESLNKFYHFVLNYDATLFKQKGLYDFTVQVAESTAILRGKIRGTLLHDEVYAIIMLGVNIERASQISRIVHAKHRDAQQAMGSYTDQFNKSYEWSTLLKCAESYDMNRRYYKKTPTATTAIEFLILHPQCPRSVMNSIDQVHKHIDVLNNQNFTTKDSAAYMIGRTQAYYKFLRVEQIETNVEKHILEIQNTLYEIATKIEEEYFNY